MLGDFKRLAKGICAVLMFSLTLILKGSAVGGFCYYYFFFFVIFWNLIWEARHLWLLFTYSSALGELLYWMFFLSVKFKILRYGSENCFRVRDYLILSRLLWVVNWRSSILRNRSFSRNFWYYFNGFLWSFFILECVFGDLVKKD